MKKITFWKSLFLLCALIVGSTSVWADDWVKTAPADLQTGDIIVVVDLSSSMAMSNTDMNSKTAPLGTAVTLNSDKSKIISEVGTDIQWTLTTSGTGSEKTYQLAKNSSTKLVVTADNNGVRVNNGARNTFLISTGGDNNGYYLNNTATEGSGNKAKTVTRYIGCYYDETNTRYDWRCYTSINANIQGNNIQFYKKNASTTHILTLSATNGSIYAVDADDNEVASEDDVAEGAELTVTANPAAGYKFKNWSVYGEGSSVANSTANPTTFTMGTADATLTANFEEDNTDYTIALTQTTGGTIEASTSSAKSGTEITLTPTPDSGYRFVSWTVLDGDANEVVVTNNKFTMPASNVEIEGSFAQEYAITINPSENGSIAASPIAGIAGETITLTATPAANYALNTVTVTDADAGNVEVSGTGKIRTFTMPAKAVTVTATFYIPKGSFLDPYTVEEIEALTENISDVYVTGYIVGCVNGSNSKAYKTTTSEWHNANLLLAADPNKSFAEELNVGTTTPDGLIPIELPSSPSALRTNWGISNTSGAVIGYKILLKGNAQNYFTGKGVKSTSEINAVSAPATISSAEYATYNNANYALNFSGTGVYVYTATDMGSYVKLNEISSGQVPANTPVVLYKANGGTVNVPVIASADEVGANDLCVSTGTDVDNMFVLAKKNDIVGFYKWAGSTDLSAGKVYLQGLATASARDYLGFDNTATGINNVEISEESDDSTPMYNLAGQRVNKSYKGVVIVNGKKVVRK